MASSIQTKQCRLNLWLCRIIDIIILVLPLIIYFFVAVCDDTVIVAQKVGLVGMFSIAVMLTVINIAFQKHLRCPIWIYIIGLYIALKNFLLPLIIILAAATVIDEFVLTPMIKYYKTKLIANRAMDERLPEEKPDDSHDI